MPARAGPEAWEFGFGLGGRPGGEAEGRADEPGPDRVAVPAGKRGNEQEVGMEWGGNAVGPGDSDQM